MNFAAEYQSLLKMLLDTGVREVNRRTGHGIVALPRGASFALDLSDNILPTCGLRRTRPHVAAAEAAWCLLGHNHCDWLRRWTKVWDAFCDVRDCAFCDGSGQLDMGDKCPNCNGSGKTYWLEQAYGYRWREKFGVDQLAVGIERLYDDPTDRRVWISSWDPGDDIVAAGQKTVPCPVGFTLSVMDNRLNSTLMIRSSDLYMGLPYDVMRHALVMAAAAATLDVGTGIMRVCLAHPHVYYAQESLCREMLAQRPMAPAVMLPGRPAWTIGGIVAEPDRYVEVVKNYCGLLEWPSFNPRAEVVR